MSDVSKAERDIIDGNRRIPFYVRFTSLLNDACRECGARNVAFRHPSVGLTTKKMCYDCGSIQSANVPTNGNEGGLTEGEKKQVAMDNDELPFFVRNSFRENEECEECSEETVIKRPHEMFTSEKMCLSCGAIQTSKITSDTERSNESSSRKSKEEASKDATRNTGKMFQTIGILFCLTIVGAIVGIPLLVLGMHIEAKGIDDED